MPEQPDHVAEVENMRSECGVQFLVGSSFYQEESVVGQDLACLATIVPILKQILCRQMTHVIIWIHFKSLTNRKF